MLERFLFAFILLAPSLPAAASDEPVSGTPADITQTIAAQRLPASSVSFAVMNPTTGRILIAQNADSPRGPASTVKILTSFAALDQLGPAFTWRTRALIRGEIENGVLDGDLIIQGGGDPYMTLERWWSFVHALRIKGLKDIRGDIVIDNSAFALPAQDPGSFDGRPNRSYNVVPDALMVNFQSIEFWIAPDRNTHSVKVIADPAPPNLVIDNRIRFAAGRCRGAASRVDMKVTSEAWDRVLFSGALSASCGERAFSRVLLKPAQYAFGTFVNLWHEQGGQFGGTLRVESTSGAKPFAEFDSLSLAEIIRLTNKHSSNLMARHLLLTMGKERFGAPATPEKGLAAFAAWSDARRLALHDVDIDNGSGLSRSTHISALQMASVLRAAYESPYAPEFMASLPLAGLDGTLKSRMKEAPPGAVRLKTGHIDAVSAVAGYVTGASGKTYILVSIVNHMRADFGAGEPVHAALVDWILANL